MAFNPRDIALVTSKDDETKKLNKKLWEALEAHDAAAVEEYLEKGAQVNYKKVSRALSTAAPLFFLFPRAAPRFLSAALLTTRPC